MKYAANDLLPDDGSRNAMREFVVKRSSAWPGRHLPHEVFLTVRIPPVEEAKVALHRIGRLVEVELRMMPPEMLKGINGRTQQANVPRCFDLPAGSDCEAMIAL